MNSIGNECNELKRQYDECFNNWFSERFLKGEKEDVCQELFRTYQSCVKNALEKHNINVWEIDKNVLGTENEQKVPPKKDKKPS